ncbi:MAG: hypothetical protein BGO21_00700 [Dyadobacter sp. 50-39]|uniref:glycosyltransferase family 2 protein n=1 Tax=Dyadobacter sp. 50-39 TaxID=1895756 RepID=UPI0009678896|nr:glycosyltransferase family 2 protein [Dyadobacter sp. 50-39]OJV16205.1 MAG: hypothetical protein BGO21_00700 [Dyadobacter sp. 50-39]
MLKYEIMTFVRGSSMRLVECGKRMRYFFSRNVAIRGIKRIDKRKIPSGDGEIRLFAVMRNESLRLPYFFKYYNDLGVNRFFLIDNNSSDDSRDIALSIENLHLYSTSLSYKSHWYWIEHLVSKYGRNHWCVVVDIDELLAYPNVEQLKLKDVCCYLDTFGANALRSVLLDLYPSGPLESGILRSEHNPFSILTHFDHDIKKTVYNFFDKSNWKHFRQETYVGGVRERIFGKNLPCHLSKISLFKNNGKVYLTPGMHALNGGDFPDISGITFHTKFLSDFIDEVDEEVQREVHYGDAIMYKIFQKTIRDRKQLSFFSENSIRYRNSSQLVSLGLMTTSTRFDDFGKSKYGNTNI